MTRVFAPNRADSAPGRPRRAALQRFFDLRNTRFASQGLQKRPQTAAQSGLGTPEASHAVAEASHVVATTSLVTAGRRLATAITSLQSSVRRLVAAPRAHCGGLRSPASARRKARRAGPGGHSHTKAPPGHRGRAELSIYGMEPIEETVREKLRRRARVRSPRRTAQSRPGRRSGSCRRPSCR